MSRLRAIVFDFDGVILESADVKTDAFCALYDEHGPEVVEHVRAHHLANLGVSRFKKFAWIAENVLRKPIDEVESQELGRRFSDLALEKVLAAPFVRGTRDAIGMLLDRYPLFVASGTPEPELRDIVDKRGITSWFREVHGTPREKPEILRDLMLRYDLAPDAVVFVGDGMSDYKAAVAAGVQFLARDTAPLHAQWVELGVRMLPDLVELAACVDTW